MRLLVFLLIHRIHRTRCPARVLIRQQLSCGNDCVYAWQHSKYLKKRDNLMIRNTLICSSILNVSAILLQRLAVILCRSVSIQRFWRRKPAEGIFLVINCGQYGRNSVVTSKMNCFRAGKSLSPQCPETEIEKIRFRACLENWLDFPGGMGYLEIYLDHFPVFT